MAHNRVVLSGTLGSAPEVWSCSIGYATALGNAVDDQSDLINWANDIMTAFGPGTGWSGALRSMLGVNSSLEKVACYHYNTIDGDADVVGESTAPAVPGSGTIVVPFQSALCVSLLTGRPGRSYRGRIYWPFLTAPMDGDGTISTTVTLATRATDFASMLAAVANAAETVPGLDPVIVSKAKGVLTAVSTVRVGDVLDTQRRRRDSIPESYGTALVP